MTQAKEQKHSVITIPNALSLLRLLFIPALFWLYVKRQNYPATAVLLLISGITDMLDGLIARRFHMVSELGKALDPIADKLTQIAMLLCLLTRFPHLLLPCAVLLGKEIVNGGMGLVVIRRTGKVLAATWHGKLSTVLLDLMLLMHIIWYDIPPDWSMGSAAVCTVFMLLSFVLYCVRNIRALTKKQMQPAGCSNTKRDA